MRCEPSSSPRASSWRRGRRRGSPAPPPDGVSRGEGTGTDDEAEDLRSTPCPDPKTFCSKENVMSQRMQQRFLPRLEPLEDRAVPSTVQRPIADFLSQQGTTSAFNPAVPGLPDNIGAS